MTGGAKFDLPNKSCREVFSSVMCVIEQSGLAQTGKMRTGVTSPPPLECTQSIEPGYGNPVPGCFLFRRKLISYIGQATLFGLDHLLFVHPHAVGMKKCHARMGPDGRSI